jgi:hypothetical protein
MRILLLFAAFAVARAEDDVDAVKKKLDVMLQADMKKQLAELKMGLMNQVVAGAPYSATGVTETLQVLADGTRIETRNTYRVHRDSAGRVAREEETKPGSGVFQVTSIHDPVAGSSYSIDPARKIAREVPLKMAATDDARAQKMAAERLAKEMDAMNAKVQDRAKQTRNTTETLTPQSFDGIRAEGMRTTTAIPTGVIGNDRPIESYFERWYSSELRVELMTKQHDPRSGDTTFRLTGIQRGEPSPNLFQVPAGVRLEGRPEVK